MKKICVAIAIIFTSVIFAQTGLSGLWNDPALNISITFYPNGQYQITSPYHGSGTYGFNGQIFWMKDHNSSQIFYYKIHNILYDVFELSDAQGNKISLKKHTPSSIPKKDPVIHQVGNFLFKKSDFNAGISFIEFLIEKNLAKKEISKLKQDWIQEFSVNPEPFLASAQDIKNSMQTILALTDPLKIGLIRLQVLSALYKNTRQLPVEQKSALVKIVFNNISVLVFDETTDLMITKKDITALVNYTQFMQEIVGNNTKISQKDIDLFQAQIIAEFKNIPLEQKQILCCLSLIWDVIEKNLNMMSSEQKQQFYQQILAQNQAVNTQPTAQPTPQKPTTSTEDMWKKHQEWKDKQLLYQTLSNVSLNSHVTTMNIIENIGGTGNYWEVRNDY